MQPVPQGTWPLGQLAQCSDAGVQSVDGHCTMGSGHRACTCTTAGAEVCGVPPLTTGATVRLAGLRRCAGSALSWVGGAAGAAGDAACAAGHLATGTACAAQRMQMYSSTSESPLPTHPDPPHSYGEVVECTCAAGKSCEAGIWLCWLAPNGVVGALDRNRLQAAGRRGCALRIPHTITSTTPASYMHSVAPLTPQQCTVSPLSGQSERMWWMTESG